MPTRRNPSRARAVYRNRLGTTGAVARIAPRNRSNHHSSRAVHRSPILSLIASGSVPTATHHSGFDVGFLSNR